MKPLPIQPEEIEVLTPRQRLSVAQWAEQKRVLSSKTTHLAGNWSNDYVPFWVEPMEALSDSGTRQVSVMKSVQVGGTEICLNFLGWAVDESPAPMLFVMPREDDANRRVNTRIKPMFEATPSLLKHVKGSIENINAGKETVLDNMILYLAWSGSAAALADNPCCHIILDEVGKYPAKSGKEADPVSLAKDRATTFFSVSKIFPISTPVHDRDLITREYNLGDKRKWWVKCVHCDQRHVMTWKNVWLDKDQDGNLLSKDLYQSGGHGFYVCPECGTRWTEQDRWKAVQAGKWAPEGCSVDPSGRIIGKIRNTTHRSYHITAMMAYPGFMTINRMAAKWAEAQLAKKTGDIGPLQDFVNSMLAEPWHETMKEADDNKLRKRIGTYPSGLVPAGVQIITIGLDVQQDHVWAAVDGWGYLSEAWSIFEARLETGDTRDLGNWKLVRDFINRTWPLAVDPSKYLIARKVAVDCAYRPEPAVDFCKLCTEIDVIPVRGDDSVKSRIYRPVKVAGGTMYRYDMNVNALKDRLYRLMYDSDVPGPGYFHFHADTNREVIEHLTSEEQRIIRKNGRIQHVWVNEKNKPNHLLDCRVYSICAAEIAGAYALRDPKAPQPRQTRRVGQVARMKH